MSRESYGMQGQGSLVAPWAGTRHTIGKLKYWPNSLRLVLALKGSTDLRRGDIESYWEGRETFYRVQRWGGQVVSGARGMGPARLS